ncbi:MAG TPA: hypothetical protein VNO21_26470 [Polyangiaceae bacterium]|nr:hypothetical protein [Polyangiaceae bacterium]
MYAVKALMMTSLLALSSIAAADVEATFRLDPVSANFTASGATTLSKGIVTVNCTANFAGATDAAGAGSVTGATFTGGSLCGGLTGAGFPWTITPSSLTAVTVQNVTVNTSLGACGPSNLAATYDNTNGALTFSNAALSGGCTVNGTLSTAPKITIVQQ